MGVLCYFILCEGMVFCLLFVLMKNKKEKIVLNFKNWIMVELRVC